MTGYRILCFIGEPDGVFSEIQIRYLVSYRYPRYFTNAMNQYTHIHGHDPDGTHYWRVEFGGKFETLIKLVALFERLDRELRDQQASIWLVDDSHHASTK